jgi:hypothetical protein
MHSEDAMTILIQSLRNDPFRDRGDRGCDIHLPKIIGRMLRKQGVEPELPRVIKSSGAFMDAAWELCRQGILRPGASQHSRWASADAVFGTGFSLTAFGRKWLGDLDPNQLPASPSHSAELLARYDDRFGAGYRERSQDAVLCYQAQAHVACCSMTGAAAESIFLALATHVIGDSADALKQYRARGGRGRVEKRIVGTLPAPLQRQFPRYTDLLKYWRDSASHGMSTGIAAAEAYSALMLLLGFATFANEHWDQFRR